MYAHVFKRKKNTTHINNEILISQLLIFVSFIESSDKNLYYILAQKKKNLYYIGLNDILCTLNFNKYKDIESCPVKCKYWKW